MGNVITVASGKGGTGKTSITAGIACAMCALGEKVLLIDADMGIKSLDMVLGMTDRTIFSYADVIKGLSSLREAAVTHPVVKNLSMLTAPSFEEMEEVGDQELAAFLALARKNYTYIFIDCAAGFSSDIVRFASLSDRAIIVSTSDNTSLRGAQSMAALMMERGPQNIRIIVNRVRKRMVNRGQAAGVDHAIDKSGLSLLGVVPEDKDVIACANKGQVLILESIGKASKACFNIAQRIRGERVPLFEGIRL